MAEFKFTGQRMVKTDNEANKAKKGAEQLLREYESLGHGRHFQGAIPEGKNFNLIKFLKAKYDLNIIHCTVLWTSHDFLFLILHEEENFI